MITAQTRRIINHTLRSLYQIDKEHLNDENKKIINHLIDYLQGEKAEDEQ